MRIGIIAEGFADGNVIKAIVKKVLGSDNVDFKMLRPKEMYDETDLHEMNFSNWNLVFDSCKNENLWGTFFEEIEGEAIIVVHVDTAERGMAGYDINDPQRTKGVVYAEYAELLRANVIRKIEDFIAEPYRGRVAYAIAVEETDAWLIPLFENRKGDTSSHAQAKEKLSALIGVDKKNVTKYVDTDHGSLNYVNLGKELAKDLKKCRKRSRSLDLFCIDLEGFCGS